MSAADDYYGASYDLAAATSAPGWAGSGQSGTDDLRPVGDDFRAEAPDLDEGASSWAAFDLGPYLRGEIIRPTPAVGMRRTDGLQFLYPGKEHWLNGETESGKSWLCAACVAAELVEGRPVVYLHFEEDDPGSTVERLQLLGVPDRDIAAGLRFAAPTRRAGPAALALLLADPAPALVILDGVNEGMSMHGQGVMEVEGVAAWRTRVVKPCTRAGAAVLQADHVAKNPEGRGRYGFGSVHKTNGANGAVFLLENAEPFGRTRRGRSRLFATKDRPGQLRQHGRADSRVTGKTYLGELVVDDSQTWSPDLECRLYAPTGPSEEQSENEAGTDPNVEARAAIVTALKASEGQQIESQNQLLAAVRSVGSFRKAIVVDAMHDLIRAGEVTVTPGRNRSQLFTFGGGLPGGSHDQEKS